MARKSRSKQRGKGVGSRSQSAGKSKGGSRSSAGSKGGSKSGGNRSGSGKKSGGTKSSGGGSKGPSGGGTKRGGKHQSGPPSKTPAPTKTIQQKKADNIQSMRDRARERHKKFKETGFQTKGGRFAKDTDGSITGKVGKVYDTRKKAVQDAAKVRHQKFVQDRKDRAVDKKSAKLAAATGIPSGANLPAGSFGISEEGKALAAKQRAESQAKKAAEQKAAREKQAADAKLSRQFDPRRLLGQEFRSSGDLPVSYTHLTLPTNREV